MSFIKNIAAYIWNLPKLYTIPAAILVVVAVGGIYVIARGTANSDVSQEQTTHSVAVFSVADYVNGASGSFTPSAGDNSFVIRAEAGGRVTRAIANGSHVAAGQTIVALESAAQSAAVTQAEGSYEAAKAALEKLSGTTVTNTSVTSAQAQSAAADARVSAGNALVSAYNALDDAIRAKSDPLFTDPNGTSPKFASFTIPDSQLVLNVENKRVGLGTVLAGAKKLTDISSGTDVDASIQTMIQNLRTTLSFLDDLVAVLNQAKSNQYISDATIATNQATVIAARSEVVSAISSLTGAKSTYDAAVSSAATAQNSAVGGSQSDIAVAEANLKAAQGALDSARAVLGKTVVRAPFAGTISAVSLAVGDVISAGTDAAIIVPAAGAKTDRSWALPLAAVKYTPSAAYVFTVGEGGAIVAHEVATGLVTKDRIVVAGLRGDESIITDIRGLKVGDIVSITQ